MPRSLQQISMDEGPATVARPPSPDARNVIDVTSTGYVPPTLPKTVDLTVEENPVPLALTPTPVANPVDDSLPTGTALSELGAHPSDNVSSPAVVDGDDVRIASQLPSSESPPKPCENRSLVEVHLFDSSSDVGAVETQPEGFPAPPVDGVAEVASRRETRAVGLAAAERPVTSPVARSCGTLVETDLSGGVDNSVGSSARAAGDGDEAATSADRALNLLSTNGGSCGSPTERPLRRVTVPESPARRHEEPCDPADMAPEAVNGGGAVDVLTGAEGSGAPVEGEEKLIDPMAVVSKAGEAAANVSTGGAAAVGQAVMTWARSDEYPTNSAPTKGGEACYVPGAAEQPSTADRTGAGASGDRSCGGGGAEENKTTTAVAAPCALSYPSVGPTSVSHGFGGGSGVEGDEAAVAGRASVASSAEVAENAPGVAPSVSTISDGVVEEGAATAPVFRYDNPDKETRQGFDDTEWMASAEAAVETVAPIAAATVKEEDASPSPCTYGDEPGESSFFLYIQVIGPAPTEDKVRIFCCRQVQLRHLPRRKKKWYWK